MDMVEASPIETIVIMTSNGVKTQQRMDSKNAFDTLQDAIKTPTSKNEGIRIQGMRMSNVCQSWIAILLDALSISSVNDFAVAIPA